MHLSEFHIVDLTCHRQIHLNVFDGLQRRDFESKKSCVECCLVVEDRRCICTLALSVLCVLKSFNDHLKRGRTLLP